MVGTIKIYYINDRNAFPFDQMCAACDKYNDCDISQNDCSKIKALYDEIYYP